MKTKRVEWSYATSPNAKRFGFYQTGCYTVEIQQLPKPPQAVAAFPTVAQARQHAETMPEPWDKLTR